MTITSADRQSYQAKVSDFERQEREDTCLSRALENVLSELANRHDESNLEIPHDDLLEICDYLPRWGCSVEPLPESLDARINQFGYNAKIDRLEDLDELEDLIEDPNRSLPLVELAPAYLHHVQGYEVQAGKEGEAMPHIVVPFTVNHDTIQFFDPYEDFYSPPDTGGAPPSQLPKDNFFQWWSGREEERWTMWVERESEQLTIEQAMAQGGGE